MSLSKRVMRILKEAKTLAREYHSLTGRPLGITGEVAESEAARILGLSLAPARTEGFDATTSREGKLHRIQIKGRRLTDTSSKSQRLGRIVAAKTWDSVIFVELDAHFEAVGIWEASRARVAPLLAKPGSKARERGQLAVSQFKRVATKIWPATA